MDIKTQFIVNELKQRLATLYGARLHRLTQYGSHARGETITGSDIDILLILDECRDFWSELKNPALEGRGLRFSCACSNSHRNNA